MNYLKIDECNMNNGDGLRCVIWVTGCNHHCYNCFNPETWDCTNGDKFCEEQIKCVFDTVSEPWCSGVTFSGGDPLNPVNIDKITELCVALKKEHPNKNIWIYTGYSFEDEYVQKHKELLENIDVLIDGEYIDSKNSLHKKWCGSSNQRVIDVQKTLEANKIIISDKA